MALTKVQADGINVADDFAFTGTVSGAGLASPFPTGTTVTSGGGAATTNIAQGVAKAWFHIVDGRAATIALGDSFNAASITDNGTGNYSFNIANDMANAVYSATVMGQTSSGHTDQTQLGSQAAGTFIGTFSNVSASLNPIIFNATVHGDLA